MPERTIKPWRVRCAGHDIGTVHETSEDNARCAALSAFGVEEGEWSALTADQQARASRHAIPPGADFTVGPA